MVQLDQFPMFRLSALLMRQVSAPIARRIKEYAKVHPRFSRTVCGRTAQLYRAADLRLRLLAAHAAGSRYAVPRPAPLSVDDARDLGANILGETVLFLLGAFILVFELNRQALKQEEKEAGERAAVQSARDQLAALGEELRRQQRDFDRLRALLARLAAERGVSVPALADLAQSPPIDPATQPQPVTGDDARKDVT